MPLNSAQKTNLSVTWILGGIATTTVITRVYVRFVLQRSPGWDDYAMMLSWCLAATSAGLASVGVHYGLGVDINDIQDPGYRVNALKYLTLAPSPSILSVAFGKLSIVLLFHRLLGVSMTRKLSAILWTLIFITACLSVAAVVAVVAFCTPTESIWDKTITPVRCMTQQTQLGIGLGQACIFYNLHMPIRRKIGLMMLFGVGVFGCVITSIKAYQLRNLTGHDNLTSSWSPITIWNTYMFVLITCANIPMMRSLFRRVLNIQSSAHGSYPLKSTPKRSLPGKTQDRYFSIENSHQTQNSISASRGTGRNSVDRVCPLTRTDSPPDGADDTGIIKKTAFSVSYTREV
ncbi:hypothetical protein BDW62DRAFT_219871 [Aspergillus aurantiobrunneus]